MASKISPSINTSDQVSRPQKPKLFLFNIYIFRQQTGKQTVLNWMPVTWKSTKFATKSCSFTVSNYKTVTFTPKSPYSQHQLYLKTLDEREGVDEHYDKPEPCNNEVRARQSSRLNMQPVPTVCLIIHITQTQCNNQTLDTNILPFDYTCMAAIRNSSGSFPLKQLTRPLRPVIASSKSRNDVR